MTGKILLILITLIIQNNLIRQELTIHSQEFQASGYLKKNKAKSNKNKNKPKVTEDSKACKPPKANLIVVNFTAAKLTLYINNKKSGTVKPLDQFIFKYVLPVGNPEVKLTSGSTPVHTETFEVLSQGKQTCKTNKTLILR